MISKVETKETLSVNVTLVVCEFLDIFRNNLLGLALEREIEFNIKFALGITLISRAPYHTALVEL